MAREVEREPAVPERLRLPRADVGHADDEDAAGHEQLRRAPQSLARGAQVLERMPEDDGGVGTLERLDLAGAEVGAGRLALEAGGRTPEPPQRVDEHAVASAHVEDGPRRRDAVKAPGEAAAEAPQDEVPGAREAAGGRAVPVAVGGLELGVGRPRIGGVGAAAPAAQPAAEALCAVQRGLAPRTGRRSARAGPPVRLEDRRGHRHIV
jgi:hypothetical protein